MTRIKLAVATFAAKSTTLCNYSNPWLKHKTWPLSSLPLYLSLL